MTKITDLHKLWLKQPGYRKVFNNSEAEFRLARELIQAKSKTSKAYVIKNPIQTEEEHALALKNLSIFFDLNPEVGSPDGDRLEELVTQIQAYEAIHFPIEQPTKLEAISFRVEQQLGEIHPGEILRKEFMKPLRLSARKLALSIGLTYSQMIQVTAGRQSITSDIALQLGKFFSMDPSFWMNLQSEYDNRMSSRTLNQSLHREINTRDIRTSYDSELADPIAKSVNNVFADLELPDAEQMLRKAHLVSKISELILNKRLNDAGAASLMGISKISLSKILKGQFRDVSEDELSSYLKQVQKARAC